MHDFFRYAPFNYTGMDYRMTAQVGNSFPYNGLADGTNIFFGSYDNQQWARSSDVVYHEYIHNVIYHVYSSSFIGYNMEGRSMDEGFADYFACTVNNDQVEAEDCNVNRTLSNTFVYDSTRGSHWNGQVIGGAVWDFRQSIGSLAGGVADNICFKALQMVPHAKTFKTFLDNFLVVAGSNYGNQYNAAILNSFSKHGIRPTYFPLTVSISGPFCFAKFSGSHTWYAQPSGGTGSYSYQWTSSNEVVF